MIRRLLTALAMCVISASLLSAHDLFIKLDTYFVPANSTVRIPILNGTFELSENSITEDRVPDVSVVTRAERERLNMSGWVAETDTTYLMLETGGPGTYVLGFSTLPRELGMAGADFNAYLEHDGIPDVLDARRQNDELEKDVWESYSKHVKSVFQVGDKRDLPKRWYQFWVKGEPAYAIELGYPAEIMPMSNPYVLEVGDEFQVRCLVDGQPVSNQLVIAGGHGAGGLLEEMSARTDVEGLVSFTVNAPGRWYIKFINMVPTAAEEIDYESKWATLTFEVQDM